jgi:quercetin dioxygenase-like cupin family protein
MAREPELIRWSGAPADRPAPLAERRRLIGEKAMVSHIKLGKGFELAAHSHKNEQISCVLSGCLRYRLGLPGGPGYREVDVGGGEAILLPSNCPHGALALEETVLLDIFSPPSQTTGVDRG